jgi:hypothetical protein
LKINQETPKKYAKNTGTSASIPASSWAWWIVFDDLKRRGLDPSSVQVGIMDGLPGLESMFKKHFPSAMTARFPT